MLKGARFPHHSSKLNCPALMPNLPNWPEKKKEKGSFIYTYFIPLGTRFRFHTMIKAGKELFRYSMACFRYQVNCWFGR